MKPSASRRPRRKIWSRNLEFFQCKWLMVIELYLTTWHDPFKICTNLRREFGPCLSIIVIAVWPPSNSPATKWYFLVFTSSYSKSSDSHSRELELELSVGNDNDYHSQSCLCRPWCFQVILKCMSVCLEAAASACWLAGRPALAGLGGELWVANSAAVWWLAGGLAWWLASYYRQPRQRAGERPEQRGAAIRNIMQYHHTGDRRQSKHKGISKQERQFSVSGNNMMTRWALPL